MSDPITGALGALVEVWRGNVPARVTPGQRPGDVLDDIFGRTRAPRSTWNTSPGAALRTRRTVEPALANHLTGILTDLLQTEAMDAGLLYGLDPSQLLANTKLGAVAARLAGVVVTEMERNTMRGAAEAIRIARADGADVATTLYSLIGTPPSAMQAAYEAFTPQDSVLTTLADTLRHDAVEWGRYIGSVAGAVATGQTIMKTWISLMDGRERPAHHALNGSRIPGRAMWDDEGVQRIVPGGWNCYPGDAVVRGVPTRLLRMRYSGLVYDVETASGALVTVTPNHPILTRAGMTGAHLLREGDEVCRDRGDVQFPAIRLPEQSDDDHAKPCIEQVWNFAAERRQVCCFRRIDDDFHGDALCGEGDIDVIAIDRELLHDLLASGAERIGDRRLELVHADFAGLPSLGHAAHALGREGRAADGIMRRRDLSLTLRGIHPRPLERFGAGAPANGDAVFGQDAQDWAAGAFKEATELQHGVALQVVGDDLGGWERIVAVRHRSFSGFVYDMETAYGVQSIAGVIASNCRCHAEYEVGVAKFDEHEPRDSDGKWTAGGSITVDGVARPTHNSAGHPIAATPEATAKFWQWFGDSKVVDDQGRPMVVYHGTDAPDFSEFTGPSYFSEHPAEASQYAEAQDIRTANLLHKKFNFVEAHGALDGERVPYIGIIDDAEPDGRVWATDHGVYRKHTNGRLDVFTDVVFDYATHSTENDGADDFMVLSTGPSQGAADDKADVDARLAALGGKGGRVYPVYLKIASPKVLPWMGGNLLSPRANETPEQIARSVASLRAKGHDGIQTESDTANFYEGAREDWGGIPRVWAVFDPEQVKSAIGNSGTFDPHDKRITKGVTVPSDMSGVAEMMSSILKGLEADEPDDDAPPALGPLDCDLVYVTELPEGTLRISASTDHEDAGPAMDRPYESSTDIVPRQGEWRGFPVALWQAGVYFRCCEDIYYLGQSAYSEAAQQAMRQIRAGAIAKSDGNPNHDDLGRFASAPAAGAAEMRDRAAVHTEQLTAKRSLYAGLRSRGKGNPDPRLGVVRNQISAHEKAESRYKALATHLTAVAAGFTALDHGMLSHYLGQANAAEVEAAQPLPDAPAPTVRDKPMKADLSVTSASGHTFTRNTAHPYTHASISRYSTDWHPEIGPKHEFYVTWHKTKAAAEASEGDPFWHGPMETEADSPPAPFRKRKLVSREVVPVSRVAKSNDHRDAAGRYTFAAGSDTTPSRPVGTDNWISTSPRDKYIGALANITAQIATHTQLAQDHAYATGPGHAAASHAHTQTAQSLRYAADHLRNALQGQAGFSQQTFRDHMVHARRSERIARAVAKMSALADRFAGREGVAKWDEHEPRDPDGKWTSGGGGGAGGASDGAIFVSPERRTGRSVDDAGKDLALGQQTRLTAALRTINAKLGLRGAATAPAVGVWIDPTEGVGAEASTITRMPKGASLETMTVAAAMAGWLAEQKGVIAFKPGAGPDAMLTVKGLRGSPGDVYTAFQQNGVENVTLEPASDGTLTAHTVGFHAFVDTDGIKALFTSVAAVAAAQHGVTTFDKGTANYVGADTREDARAEYEKVIAGHRRGLGGDPGARGGAGHSGGDGLGWWDDLARKWRAGQTNRGEALAKAHGGGNPNHDALGLFASGPGGHAAPASPAASAVHAAPVAEPTSHTLILPPLSQEQLRHANTLPALTPYDTPEIKLLREAARSVKQTADLPGREAIRQHAEVQMYGSGAARKERIAHIIMGGPGTGKSTALGDTLVKESGALLIDSDEAKKFIPEFDGGKGAGVVHVESSDITDRVLARAALAGDNIVNPVVGKTLTSLDSKISDLVAMGYQVHLHLVDLPVDGAVQRVLGRMKSSKRFVDTDYVVNDVDGKPKANFEHLREDPRLASADAYDNNVGKDQPPHHTYHRERAPIHKVAPGRGPGDRSGRDASHGAPRRPAGV